MNIILIIEESLKKLIMFIIHMLSMTNLIKNLVYPSAYSHDRFTMPYEKQVISKCIWIRLILQANPQIQTWIQKKGTIWYFVGKEIQKDSKHQDYHPYLNKQSSLDEHPHAWLLVLLWNGVILDSQPKSS